MSALERVLAAILLGAAVGGTAVFAHRIAGTPVTSGPVELTAPPRQHVPAARPVFAAPLPASARPLTRPSLPAAAVAAPTFRPVVVSALTEKHVAGPRPVAPASAPTAAPAAVPVTPAQPVEPPEPPRVLASVEPPTEVCPDGHEDGRDH